MSESSMHPELTPEQIRVPSDLVKPRLRRAEACRYLSRVHGVPIKPSTLATWATRGGGPAFQKSGPTPLYTPEELDRWALARLGRLRASTSDQG